MGCLYIGGAQCKYAEFKDEDDWEKFDNLENKMESLAKNFNVYVNRYKLDDNGDYCFVISNKPVNHECFYSGAAFSYDMKIETSQDFNSRANQFISALNKEVEFSCFHDLSWSESENLYFVTS